MTERNVEKIHEHKWTIYSTALANHCLLVKCECGKRGSVDNPTREEWKKAFHAPSHPYEWTGGNERVNIDRN